ncbi:UNVERIFIED_CONTAM: DUF1573 domain-containing protein [Prevotella sp. 15_C9]
MKILQTKYFTNSLLYFLSLIFLLSGITKLLNIENFENEIALYSEVYFSVSFIAWRKYIAILICCIELGTVILSFFKRTKTLSLFIYLLLLIFFTILMGVNYFSPPITGSIQSCGCFGELINFTPQTSFYKSLILLIIALLPVILFLKNKRKGNMKKIFIVTFIIMTLYSCSENKNKTSRIVESLHVENAYFDMGEIDKNLSTIQKFSFNLENIGNRTITIHSAKPSCGCVVVQEIPTRIPPKEIRKLQGYIDLKNQKGNLSKVIFVDFDKDKIMLLRVIGKVQ